MFSQSSSFLQQPSHAIGKKRSHEEASHNLEPDTLHCNSQHSGMNGEGMVFVKPRAVSIGESDNQSGAQLDDVITEQDGNGLANGPPLRSHKSQRLLAGSDHASSSKPTSATSLPNADGSETSISDEIVIDHFTLHLGIGWKRIKDSDHVQAAARGWARFIENNYPLTNVNVLLESKGLQSYLVESTEGFYLFTEDLRQAQLVSQNATKAIQNLQQNPPIFDSVNILAAEISNTSNNNVKNNIFDI
ncbi:hypothetical protein HDV63DRAFT_398457 [Trichoderma sp. SZMC 28014]